jgi:hypothetical protein
MFQTKDEATNKMDILSTMDIINIIIMHTFTVQQIPY